MTVFTIGYGGRGKADFLALLRAHGVATIVDIRLRPERASMGIWVKAKTADRGLEAWLAAEGVSYRSLVELGNVFLDQPNWMPPYRELIRLAGGLLTQRLSEVVGPYCLMCAEKRAAECHRLPVAEFLADARRAKIVHIE